MIRHFAERWKKDFYEEPLETLVFTWLILCFIGITTMMFILFGMAVTGHVYVEKPQQTQGELR